jgi:hypothetical protein
MVAVQNNLNQNQDGQPEKGQPANQPENNTESQNKPAQKHGQLVIIGGGRRQRGRLQDLARIPALGWRHRGSYRSHDRGNGASG